MVTIVAVALDLSLLCGSWSTTAVVTLRLDNTFSRVAHSKLRLTCLGRAASRPIHVTLPLALLFGVGCALLSLVTIVSLLYSDRGSMSDSPSTRPSWIVSGGAVHSLYSPRLHRLTIGLLSPTSKRFSLDRWFWCLVAHPWSPLLIKDLPPCLSVYLDQTESK